LNARTVYHTVIDTFDPDNIESEGPFLSPQKSNWLGRGYYFWETYIELAHWWGRVHIQSDYIICQADLIIDETCWDLYNDPNHREEFKQAYEYLRNSQMTKNQDVLVHQVIEYLKKIGSFNYKAIRAQSERCANINDSKVYFHSNNQSYYNLICPIQICLCEKKALSLQNFRVVFPQEYSDDSYC
jgi:hypothetical protein